MPKITWEDKVGIIPKQTHINQWWDEDANELKDVSDEHDDNIADIVGGGSLIDVSAEWTSGLSFDVVANNYPVDSTFYESTSATVTLDTADGSHPRIDLITAIAPVSPATVGTVGKITGTAAASPAEPDYDPSLVYPIKFVLVNALATTPVGVSTELVYNEDLGAPTEWAATENTGAVEIVKNSTNDSFSGTKSVEFTSSNTVDVLTLTRATTLSTRDIGIFSFYVKQKASLAKKSFVIKFYNGSTQVGSAYYFNNGDHNFDSSLLTWQKISIEGTAFNLVETSFDTITIQIGSNGYSGAYLDYFNIHIGSENDVVTVGIPDAPVDGNTYGRKDAGWTSVTSLGEANTASNVGAAGVGVFNSKVASDLQFKNINTGSSKVTVTDDAGNNEIDIDIVEANIALGNIDTDGLTYPTSDGTANQVIQTDGAGNLTFGTVSANTAESVHINIRKSTAGTIVAGTPVYYVGWNVSGYVTVEAADANDPNKMPALGITTVDTDNSATVDLIVSGIIDGLDTTAWSGGDELWVSDDPATTMGLTNTKPQTVDDAIQKVAIVLRSNVANGVIQVIGAGRSNDVPNIASDNFWLGSAAGAATPTNFTTEVNTNAAVAANTAKISNATHTGEVTGNAALTVDKTAITGKSAVTAVGADYVLISDTGDSGNLKKALVSDMVTKAEAQTVTGVKTFEDAKLLFRNVADTFSSWFTNVATAARTWTMPDKTGTVALLDDVTDRAQFLIVAFSDETTVVDAGTAKVTFTMPNYATTLTDVAVSFITAPTTSAITLDLNEAGTSVLSTKITVDATEFTSETAATPPVISDSSLAANAIMSVDVDTADSGGTSAGGKLIIYFNKT